MDKNLSDVLHGKAGNYMLPFYWQHGDHTESIPAEIERIWQSGCRAFCVESRPHRDFAGEGWWRDMDVILAEAKKRDMDVWILDDDHFPTGHANGAVKTHPELRPWQIGEEHLDVMGPLPSAAILLRRLPDEENRLIGIYAYPRTGNGEEIAPEPIDLTANVQGRYLRFDIPDGCYRIYFLYQTRQGAMSQEYIDMMNPDSVRLLIDAVYEPHYAHYRDEFGKTIRGFFSDEPRIGNTWFSAHACEYRYYETRIGLAGMAYPWREGELVRRMTETLSYDPMPYLAALWCDMGKKTAALRHAYMDAVSSLYRDSFTRQLGDWCRAHGVQYIGHIIEDNDSHARLGCSAGHYFRSLDGQDMSGIDVVLHQILPGMSQYIHTASAAWNRCDPAFFDCVLAKLGSSFAHINPQMDGRAMCEIFGAYGWAEGASCMRYLLDHMLVRGINRFVPHAFSPSFPDPDCPPHFGGGGVDPQFEAFSTLMRYGNNVAHLFEGAVHCADAAILYHGEAEWMSPLGAAMTTGVPAKLLSEAHIDYDILPIDCFLSEKENRGASVYPAKLSRNGSLSVGGEKYRCLILPYAPDYPQPFLTALEKLEKKGLRVYRMGVDTDEASLVREMKKQFTPDVQFAFDYPELRFCHYRRRNLHIYMFVNESASTAVETVVRLSDIAPDQELFSLDLLHDGRALRSVDTSEAGAMLHLEPYQSVLWICDTRPRVSDALFSRSLLPYHETHTQEANLPFTVELSSYDRPDEWERIAENTTELPDISRLRPDFSGTIRYTARFTEDDITAEPGKADLYLTLPYVGESAHAWLNGEDLGLVLNPPYRFRLTAEHASDAYTLVIEVKNTLANAVCDPFSTYMPIRPAGILGKPYYAWDNTANALTDIMSVGNMLGSIFDEVMNPTSPDEDAD